MADPLLDVRDHSPGIGLIPASVKLQIAGQVLRLDLAALFLPQP
jgi:hypothetical protein